MDDLDDGMMDSEVKYLGSGVPSHHAADQLQLDKCGAGTMHRRSPPFTCRGESKPPEHLDVALALRVQMEFRGSYDFRHRELGLGTRVNASSHGSGLCNFCLSITVREKMVEMRLAKKDNH